MGDTLETEAKTTPFTFLNMVTAKWTTQLLAAAAELGVADTLKEGPLSSEEIAERTQANAPMMYRLLRALSALGVVEALESHRFRLTELGQYLRSDIPGSMRALAMMTGRPWHNRGWEQLAHCVKTGAAGGVQAAFGTNLWDYFDKPQNRADFDNFNEAMTGASASMHGAATESYDFSRFNVLADIGGGHGRLLGTILQRTPGLSGVLFDRPSLKQGAEAELQKMGITQRCRFVGGDFFTSVPPGADAYMMSHILHDWPDDRALTLLRNCREALKPGGTLLVFDAVIKPGIDHDWGALMDLEIFMMFGGRDRTEEEFSQLFRQAGFRLNRIIPTRSSVSIVEGTAV
jgi:SAM-dependent methyltransferase